MKNVSKTAIRPFIYKIAVMISQPYNCKVRKIIKKISLIDICLCFKFKLFKLEAAFLFFKSNLLSSL